MSGILRRITLRGGAAPRKLSRKTWLMASLALGLAGPVAAQSLLTFEATSSNATTGVMNLSTPYLGFGQLSDPSTLTTGSNPFNYVALPFIADSTRTYVLGQTSAPVDTVLILYLGSFDPTQPGRNAVTGNDDSGNHAAVGAVVISCGSPFFCPQVSYDLTRGQHVVMVASTFSPGTPLTLPMTFYTVPVGTPPATDIAAEYTSAELEAGTVLPVFRGGTLRLVGDVITQDFTVDGAGGTIDQNGHVTVFTGSFSNDGTTPGRIVIVNGGSGGKVILFGTQSFTGGYTVGNGAMLVVNGNTAASSGIEVQGGGVLGGSGTTPGVTVAAGGSLAPGNSIGTLTVAGNLALAAGSRYVVEYAPGGADRVNVSGTTSLAGQLVVVPVDGAAPVGTIHRIVASGGAVSGSFSGIEAPVTGLAPNARLDVIYGAGSVDLAVTPQRYAAVGLSRNQVAVGQALDAVRPAAGLRLSGPMAALFNGLYPLSQPQAAQALTEASGEVATGASAMGFLAGGQFLAAMMDPLSVTASGAMGQRLAPGGDARQGFSVWGTPFGAYNRTDGNAADGSGRRSLQGAGFALGLDMRHGADGVMGVAVAAGEGRAAFAGGRGTAHADYAQAGAYANTRIGDVTIAAAGGFTQMEIDTKRTLGLLGGTRQDANASAQVYSFRVEARHDSAAIGAGRLMPLAAIQAQRVNSQGYTERAPAAGTALRVPGQGSSAIRTEIGAQAEASSTVAGQPLRGFVRAAWGHYIENDVSMTVGLAAPESPRFTVRGARGSSEVGLVSAGLETAIAPGVTLGARLDGEVSPEVSQIAGTLRLRYAF